MKGMDYIIELEKSESTSTKIFIPFNVPSSKNSKRIVKTGGRPMLISSEITLRYKKNTTIFFNAYRNKFHSLIKDKPLPYHVNFRFIRDTKRKFDLINAAQIVQDLMVDHNWLEDDNYTILNPSFSYPEVDKKNCGVEISVVK